MAANIIGSLSAFQPENERIEEYLERVQLYFDANGIQEDKQVAVLLTVIGSGTYALLSSLLAPTKPRDKSFKDLADTLRQHFDPKPIVIAERYHFYKRDQGTGESISEYLAELRRMATHCDFGTFLDQALRDRFVCGLRHQGTQKRLLSESDLTLTKATEIARSGEAAEKQVVQFKDTSNAPVMLMSSQSSKDAYQQYVLCSRCGGNNHLAKDCRFKDALCHKCNKPGHLARMCRSKPTKGYNPQQFVRPNNWVETRTDDGTNDFGLFQVQGAPPQPFTVELSVEGRPLTFEVDTGAAVTLISEATYNQQLNGKPLQESAVRLKTYTQERVQVLGEVSVQVSYGTQRGTYLLYVVKGTGVNLLGRDWLRHIRLDWKAIAQTVNSVSERYQPLLDKYSEVFREELGTLKSIKAKLHIKPQAMPKFCKPRAVPFALKEALGRELARLEELGILQKVDRSDWAAPVVVVPKGDGCLRVCGDYKITVNPVLEVDKYPLPRPDDLLAQLAGGKTFSKLDLSQAYQQVLLDEGSRKFVTINTHQGLYQYTRVPFGIASAPALFQKIMDTILQGIPGTICYLDDILVTGTTEADHLRNLEEVLKRLQANGLRVKPQKCRFMEPSVEYLGHRIDAKGVHTTSQKVEAILQAPAPQNPQQLRSFLGLLHYYGKFLQSLSTLLYPLNQLLKSNSRWKWSADCQQAFQQAKEKLASAPILSHYDPAQQIKLAADASAYGVGAVISHAFSDGSERPIAYASRTLSDAERNYAQIDKEALALVFAVKKFHNYLYGRKFVLVTDHKPLVTLFGPKKAIPPLAAARLQRWAIILSAYAYEIEYKPTSQHANADSLSRLPLKVVEQPSDETVVFNIAQIEALPVTALQVAAATRKDPLLSQVFRYTQTGWPHAVDSVLLPYWNRRTELTIEGGCLLWGIRVVVPQKLQETVLAELHRDHPGMVRMKAVARSFVWWEGLDEAIESVVRSCQACQSVRNLPATAPLHPWLWPTKPWQRIHVDFAGPFQGRMFLLVIDAHSKWPEIIEMKVTTASKTIDEIRKLCAAYGLPEQIVSDNGPQFVSEEFATFTKMNGIKHIKSAPYHPATNGSAERLVQTFKKAMRAGEHDGRTTLQRLSSFLLSYRSTPHSTTHEAPSQLFLKRSLRTRLDLLKPDVNSSVCLEQAKQKSYHDRRCRVCEYSVGQPVQTYNFRSGPRWVAGVVVRKLGSLTYLVQVNSGVFWRRHVDHLRPAVDSAIEAKSPVVPERPDLSLTDQTNYAPYNVTEIPEQLPLAVPEQPPAVPEPPAERRYPVRENRRPPLRYTD